MLFTIDREKVEYIPHKKEYDIWRSRLSDRQYVEIMTEMEKVLSGRDVAVSSFVPGKDWGYPYYYIYEACEEDQQHSAFFFGLLFWEAVQKHPDNWSFQKYDNDKELAKAIKGMTYFKIKLD